MEAPSEDGAEWRLVPTLVLLLVRDMMDGRLVGEIGLMKDREAKPESSSGGENEANSARNPASCSSNSLSCSIQDSTSS